MQALPRVLVVDDYPDNLDCQVEWLTVNGCAAVGVGSVAAAREQLRLRPLPDVIVLDLAMPRENGFALLDFLEADPAMQRIKVIVSTGHPEACRRALADPRVTIALLKPHVDHDLVDLVDLLTGRRMKTLLTGSR